MSIEGDHFPPSTWRLQLAQFLGFAKIAVIVCVVAAINPFPFLGLAEPPSWFQWLCNNKLYGCLMIFFVSNAIETQLISTGAFEISLDELPVWSKIESGRIPQPPELFQIIENHFKLNTGGQAGAGAAAQSFRDEL